jgi:nucleoside-diphosphate-sugar epimerase
LIGSTGFVGSTLLGQAAFDATFHSTNIEALGGQSYSLGVCAAAPAAKWKANQEPEADLANLRRLMSNLERASFTRFVLISTVDVYPSPVEVDEDSPLDAGTGGAYGRHRLLLEQFARERFPTTVLRLPGLFGHGLRKNAIYDLLHDNALEALQPASSFQFYDMSGLWADIQRCLAAGVATVNFATEPLLLGEIARKVFGRELPKRSSALARYDFRTRHARLWSREGPYLQGHDEVLRRLQAFVAAERREANP